MKPISKEYLLLFNALSDTEAALDALRQQLMEAQQQAEELFLQDDAPDAPPSCKSAEA